MSSVVNDSFEAGELVIPADLNEKFTDVSTVTAAAMDGANLRNEALDRFQITHNTAAATADIILVRAESQSNGASHTAGTVYPATETRTDTELAHDSGSRISFGVGGQVLETNDVLRVYWHLWVDNFTVSETPLATRSNACWLVWLQWDITSNALANWVSVPGQASFTTDYGADGSPLTRVVGGPVSSTAATMVIPHMARYSTGGGASDYLDINDWTAYRHYNYVNTGGNITVYGLRLMIDGLFYPWYTAAEPTNRFVHQEDDPFFQSDDIEVGPIYMIALVQRTR